MFQIHKKLKDTYKALLLKQVVGGIFLFSDEFFGVMPLYFVGVALDQFKSGEISQHFIITIIAKIAGFSLLSYTVSVLWMFFVHNSGNYGGYFLRRKFFASLLKKPMNFFEKYKSGDLLARANNDVDWIDSYFGAGFLLLMDSFAYPIVFICIMGSLTSWKLTLATVAPFPIITILYFFTADELEKRAGALYGKFSIVSQEILQMAEGIKLVRSFCNEQVRLQKLSRQVKLYFDAVYFKVKLAAILLPITGLVTEVATIIAFCYGSVLVYRGEITYGNLASFFMFVYSFTWAAMASSKYVELYKGALASANRLVEVLDAKEKEHVGNKELKSIESIEFKHFNFAYNAEQKNVLQDFSFSMKKGERVAVVGKTGSGKTTLARSLLNLYEMKDGLFVNGEDYRTFSSTSYKKQIGYVSQREQVFSDTIFNNVSFFDTNCTEDEVNKVLEMAHMDDVKTFPSGLYTQIGERGMSLSGGQRQRLSIARALIARPSLLILDDAFSAIDAKTTSKIIRSLKATSDVPALHTDGAREQKESVNELDASTEGSDSSTFFDSLLVITHKPSISKEMDRIIVMEDGKICEEGNHDELMKKGGWYALEFSMQEEEVAV